MEEKESEDIYYVEIENNERFNGVYVNKKAILEEESIYDKYGFKDVDTLINEINNLNISNKFKIYLLKSEFEIFRLKNELRDMKKNFKQLKRDTLGTEDDNIDIEENTVSNEDMDEDELLE